MADQLSPSSRSDVRRWAEVVGEARRVLSADRFALPREMPTIPGLTDAATLGHIRDLWVNGLTQWEHALSSLTETSVEQLPGTESWPSGSALGEIADSYALVSGQLLASMDILEGMTPATRGRLQMAMKSMLDAMHPRNFPATNPEVMARTIETGGENLLKGLANLLADLARGQLTHVAPGAFEVGRNLATTRGKVIHRTPLYELIQYAPSTDRVLSVPVVIFPPWINRFYILDLNPNKSFIRWAVGKGLTVFMVSWKSADATMADMTWDDYVAAQREAIDLIRGVLDVPYVHAIGYCVAGTTLAATLAVQAACGEADKIASATFFAAQVDFSQAGDLGLLVDDSVIALTKRLSAAGFLDGRFMAAAFNALRAQDLIWKYVINHYLLGHDYTAFDVLYWNGDTTNLPGTWHVRYLTDLYRDNLLVEPGALSICGIPIDLRRVQTPTYVQAGREDHIAPAASVFKLATAFGRHGLFVLAGSGHIAGVINPPAARKYQFWTNSGHGETFDMFLAGATETKGSWWPHWLAWLRALSQDTVPAIGSRLPGGGALPALGDAPGEYVRMR